MQRVYLRVTCKWFPSEGILVHWAGSSMLRRIHNSHGINMRISEGKTGKSLSKIGSNLTGIVGAMPEVLQVDQHPVLCRCYVAHATFP